MSPANSETDSAYASMFSESDYSKSPQWQPRLGPPVAPPAMSLGHQHQQHHYSPSNHQTNQQQQSAAAAAAATMQRNRSFGVAALRGGSGSGSAILSDRIASAPVAAASNPIADDFSLDGLKGQLDAAFGFGGGFQIKVLGVPLTNARSRVETQTKLCLQMVNALGNKTSLWSHLRLPEQLVTKEKLRKSQNVVDYSLIPLNKVLDLQAVIVCASDPKKDVQICSGCQQRELKRSKKKSESSNDIKMEDVFNGLESNTTAENDSGKIVLFNCGSYVDFSSGDTILPTRITCYCRHHNEKTGFCVYFIARDHNSNVIATGISPPILITDDHKGTKAKGQKRSRADELSDMIPEMQSPTSPPNTVLRPQSDFQDDIIAQFIPALLASESNAPLFENFGIRKEDPEFRRTKKQFQSPPPQSAFSPASAVPTTPSVPSAIINRIIPGEGPIQGGVEITILGENIHNGLIAVFGDLDAITTQVWGTSTMICILPPSSTPGPVPVTLKAVSGFSAPAVPDIPVTFMYKDDLDRSLMELALQVVGLRMTGSLDSARNIAMRIVNETAQETMNDSALNFNELKRNQLETAVLNALFSLEEHTDELNDAQQVVLTSLLDMTFHSSNGLNSLHIAALAGMTTLVKYLISLDCDMDPRDKNGFTPLMFAIQSRNYSTMNILLQAGASHLLTSKNGVSCYNLAKKNGMADFNLFLKALEETSCDGGMDQEELEEMVEGVTAEQKERASSVSASISTSAPPTAVPDVLRGNGGITRRLSCPNVFSVPAVPEFKKTLDGALPKLLSSSKLVDDVAKSKCDDKLIKRVGSSANIDGKPKGLLEANNIRWTNPEEELKNIMDGFKMFSFLGPLVHTMANPLIVQRVDVNFLFNEHAPEVSAAAFAKSGLTSRGSKKEQKKLDQTVSVVPFSGFGDEDQCCESWNNGLGTTHQDSCRKAIQLKKDERKQRRKQRALWLFWLPLFTLAFMLLLFYVMLSEEEMAALLDRFLIWNEGVVSKVKDTYQGLQKDSKSLVFEFLNTGFGKI
ncbi:UNVERIFIED_CONTAM: SPT3 Dosage dependent suppressor of Ty-induced promoter mutations-like protein [Siphonaria sp. JEL0065]|nr:SPT3 Dosage dependent suppressor of Ty-induced promoter mutations-like protein [Siphonaria sp. JEL0065]